jgi:RNA exonuclease 4
MVEIDKLSNGLARISVVNEHGDVIVDTFCKPPGIVSDYRYEITGLTPSNLDNAIEYDECRKIVKFFITK